MRTGPLELHANGPSCPRTSRTSEAARKMSGQRLDIQFTAAYVTT